MKKWMYAIIVSAITLAGCGETGNKDNDTSQEVAPVAIEAVLDIPEKADPGQEVALAVTVTQVEEFVDDANEVKFEIWKEGQKEASEMVVAEHSEKGKYIANYKFPEDGVFSVQSHVTARDMHTMPTKTIQIGHLEEEHHEHKEDSDDHGHSHHGDVSINLDMPDHVQANKQTDLVVHLEKDEQPLSNAAVRLEIFQQGANPAWVDTAEGAKGEYKTEYQFPASGEYTVRIHVENDEGLHEHTEVKVTVH
ncbi:FixH family protein [Bacillus sp. FJAT-29790]|uniref:FixH family protein n=1 Tax=Bacillus sp. FJAT-29790 TaxID=1895002 RepID=UPI001C229389|nr:FixH family protein [Bacillus sp. FJAT-29790]MBU8880838.1 FixH family protein [Bacillus sp. FJAT-29790]